MKIFVGNLSFGTTEENVRFLFETHGRVDRVSISKDGDTGRSKGFGFVEMPDTVEARNAVEALTGRQLGGRPLTVDQSRPPLDRGFGDGAFRANVNGYRRTEARS